MLRLIVTSLLCTGLGTVMCSAQTFSDSFELTHPEEDDFKDIEVNESLFYGFGVVFSENIYDSAIRYGFRFTQIQRRGLGEIFSKRRLIVSDISERINRTPDYMFYSILNDATVQRYGGMAFIQPGSGYPAGETDYLAFAGADKTNYAVSATYSDRRNRGSVRFRVSGNAGRNWNYLLQGARRWGQDRHITGQFGDMSSFSMRLGKAFSDGSALNLFAFAAPVEQGTRMWTTKETFELTGNGLYNPSWGRWSDGKIRNSRVRKNFTPFLHLIYVKSLFGDTYLRLGMALKAGHKRYSTIDWWNAPNPYPDYYAYLPSGYDDPGLSQTVSRQWRDGNENYTAIDWEEMRTINRNSTKERGSAAYILGNRVERIANGEFSASVLTPIPTGNTDIRYGIALRSDNSVFYKEAKDMLGIEYVYNIDRFDLKLNDVGSADDRVYEGDKYDYHYSVRRSEAAAHFSGAYREGRFRALWNAELIFAALTRKGYYAREGMDDSKGRSAKQSRTTYNARAGIMYAFNADYSIAGSAYASSREPNYETLFVYPAYSNTIFSHVPDPKLAGVEGSVKALPFYWLQVDAAGYYHLLSNQTEVYRYYDDYFGGYAIMRMDGASWSGAGVELAARAYVTERLSIRTALSLNKYRYMSDGNLNIVSAGDFIPLLTDGVSRINGFNPVTSPEQLFYASASYDIPYKWRFELNYQHVSGRYVSMNPLRRATHITASAWSPEQAERMKEHERLPAAGTLNLYARAQFRFASKFSFYVSLAVANLLDKKDIIYGGYEQMRFHKDSDTGSFNPFDTKYAYNYPRTFTLTLSCYW